MQVSLLVYLSPLLSLSVIIFDFHAYTHVVVTRKYRKNKRYVPSKVTLACVKCQLVSFLISHSYISAGICKNGLLGVLCMDQRPSSKASRGLLMKRIVSVRSRVCARD